jgi:glutamyl-Q tRNA(Asp) synthetase
LLQQLLGYPSPRYLHVPAAANAQGEKLSKQTLAPAVDARHAGAQLLAALDFLGQHRPGSKIPAEILAEAARLWDPARIPRRVALAVPAV